MKVFIWTVWLSPLFILVADLPGHSATIPVGKGFEYETLSAAISAANQGDVLLVAPGVYDVTGGESFPLTPQVALTIRGSSSESRPTIRADVTPTVFFFYQLDAVILDSLEVLVGRGAAFRISSSTVEIRG